MRRVGVALLVLCLLLPVRGYADGQRWLDKLAWPIIFSVMNASIGRHYPNVEVFTLRHLKEKYWWVRGWIDEKAVRGSYMRLCVRLVYGDTTDYSFENEEARRNATEHCAEQIWQQRVAEGRL